MATMVDVERVIAALPGVTQGERWDRRTWDVGGKTFAWERPFSKADIRRFGTETPPDGPIVAVAVIDLEEKDALLLTHPKGIFTIPHFNGCPAILSRASPLACAVVPVAVPFRCPHCGQPLEPVAGGLVCGGAHRFDLAAEGYVNLLVGGRKPSRPAGDSAAMIAARRAFFERGHYRPVADAVATVLADAVVPVGGERGVVLLDAGCGEGAYLARAVAELEGRGHAVDAIGIDVSKPAVRLAARHYREGRFAVASSFAVPLADHVVDAVVTVFAPRAFTEFHRIARPGGVVVVASPGPDHLDGLKRLLYNDPRRHDERPHTSDDGGAPNAPEHREQVRFELVLAGPQVSALLQMTPYWWHATDERRVELAALDELRTTIDVVVTRHRS